MPLFITALNKNYWKYYAIIYLIFISFNEYINL